MLKPSSQLRYAMSAVYLCLYVWTVGRGSKRGHIECSCGFPKLGARGVWGMSEGYGIGLRTAREEAVFGEDGYAIYEKDGDCGR